ncbi:MAG: aldo/keto reductase [Lachnospiraceae bacterium]|nr:aldo/keto reductase [Lachnospiraceae bacterium]
MRYRNLGFTGLKVSEIGFGTIPILSGRVPVLPQYFSPDNDTAIAIMKKAFDYGCNFYDTAIIEEYGDAETKLGLFAKTIDRNKIIISDKARFYGGGDIYREVLRSTENLGTRPDIYFVHQVDEDNADEVFSKGGALDALYDLKREGKIGFTGIASHYYDILYRGAVDKRVDVLQGSGNILERGMIDRIREEKAFKSKGFILNKVYAAGLLIGSFNVSELIGGILEYPFSCALIGAGTFEQASAAFEMEYEPVHFEFDDVINRLSEHFEPIGCDRCERCICPQGHEIHTSFRQYNYFHLGKEFWAANKLKMDLEKTAIDCRNCTDKVCMKECRRGLYIPGEIERIVKLLGAFGKDNI